eukprot:8329613-Prorocentrum_lima.AAC.1
MSRLVVLQRLSDRDRKIEEFLRGRDVRQRSASGAGLGNLLRGFLRGFSLIGRQMRAFVVLAVFVFTLLGCEVSCISSDGVLEE